MCCVFLLYFMLTASGVLTDNSLKEILPMITTYEGGTFFQRVFDVSSISNCTASFSVPPSQTTIELDVNSKEAAKIQIIIELDINSDKATFLNDFQDTTNLKSRLHSIGSGFCGFKLENVSLNDPTIWLIEATSNGKSSVAKFELGVYNKLGNMDIVKEVTLGSSITLDCLGGDYIPTLSYCLLYDPKEILIYKSNKKCSHSINAVTNEDIGVWKCVVGGTPYLKSVEYKITVTAKEIHQNEKWLNETNDYISFGCILAKGGRQTHCIMTSPTGEKLLIREGVASSRYTSIYTNLQESICALEIQKPLLDTEVGPWRCEMGDDGLFIQVGDKNVIPDVESAAIAETGLGTPLQLYFQVPYPINDCIIISPIGERYKLDYQKIKQGLGECWLEIGTALPEHNGTWICSFVREDNVIAEQQKIDVFVKNAIKHSEKVSTGIGNEATMYCNSVRSALKYCWFISPSGKTYLLKNEFDVTGISYIGAGLEFGDCGIKIHNIQEEDVGNWSCVIKMGGTEYVNTIVLDLSPGGPISLAAGLGAGIGSCIILFTAVGGLLYRKYKRTPENTQLNQGDTASDTSSEIVILSELSRLQQNRADQLQQYTL